MDSAAEPLNTAWAARPFLHGPEREKVVEALLSGNWGNGPTTQEFEARLADFLGVPDVVAVASGTVALQLALLAAGVGPGDEVVVPSLTFCASVQAIRACGAHPRFAEVRPDTLCVEGEHLLSALTPRTRAVMPVLYGGRAVDLTGVQEELDDRGVTVVEDAAHAFGSYAGAKRVGGTGALTAFSFDPIKNLTTGEGGAVVPRDRRESEAVRRMRDLGMARSARRQSPAAEYSVASFGVRARMSSMNAAIGIVQLQHFSKVEALRRTLWRTYEEALRDLDGVLLVDVDVENSTPFHCVIRIPSGRDDVLGTLTDRGVAAGVPYPPNHLEPAFARWYRKLPATELVGRQIMSLPFHPHMDARDVRAVASALRSALAAR
ncbi:DegT/DnrJ/EryC1/StrS family aminotransferase [Streptomyces mutabilis]|uniref:DegT/DnrJ/EryC1/StrS family aminotransferase n=1 Tax=Streptomyces TaxID=1883 RepID=UPI000BD77F20|nr:MULTISPECIES: DegT/DnrJ/EryC1/StrS family aminotransferase [unclassified Streptomyces]MDG9694223.1 DegT/DnrJ/EryC1/StrS family aminotransferase [Streptomyces sp. DH17]MDN3256381.1 DegT/DnrJ/EryC1/StrS family aminotransferase [Streptomyces sp. MA25(2023)]PAM99186.1 DegT/DnrJ/EryC1/StrS aminotransferase [Streptomyces sp. Alain-F2R5]